MDPISLEEMKSVKLMNRTDTKFVTSRRLLEDLLRLVDSDYYVQTTNNQSVAPYHTLYYDTEDCRMYLVHHNGWKKRQKLRIRSYVDSDLHFLEVKTKDNHGKTKKVRVELDVNLSSPGSHCFDSEFTDALIQSAPLEEYSDFLGSNLRYDCCELKPKIENSFSRMTLVNKQKTERLTIDTGLQYRNIVNGQRLQLDNIAIIELKRDSLQPSPILPFLNQLRIFSMGFSKYCMGMALTNPNLKQNLFKSRLRMIGKL